MHEFLVLAISYIVPLTELLGAAVVTWGCAHGTLLVARRAWHSVQGQAETIELRDIRIVIGEKMALGLDSSSPATSSAPSSFPAANPCCC